MSAASPVDELVHLRKSLAVATNSFQEAQLQAQLATQQSTAVNQALQQAQLQPHALASGAATEQEEQRLREKLEAIQAERERAKQVEKLQAEAERAARAAAAAEMSAKMRQLHLEKVEAQQEAAAARAEAQDAVQRATLRSKAAARLPEPVAAASTSFGREPESSATSRPAAALLSSSSTPAETDAMLSVLDLQQQVMNLQTRLRSQTRLTSSLQDKLRKTEETLRETHNNEQTARADCTRHAAKRKEESEEHQRSVRRLEKRTETAEQKANQLQADNNALRDDIVSLRQAVLEAERRVVAAEDGRGPASRIELRRITDELNEERRKNRAKDREHKVLMEAQEKSHRAALHEWSAKHDARKVSLKHAVRMKDAAMDKLQAAKRRADVAEQEAVWSHWEAQQLAAEKTTKALAPRNSSDGGGGSSKRALTSSASAANLPVSSIARPAASIDDWHELSDARSSYSPPPQAPPPPPAAPTLTRAQEELERERLRSVQLPGGCHRTPADKPPYSWSSDTLGLYPPDERSPSSDLFDRAPPASSYRQAGELKDRLASSLSRMGDLFRTWDRNGSGRIDRSEFRAAVKALGISAPDHVCDAIFGEFDTDHSGTIEYGEYVTRMLKDAIHRSVWRVIDVFRRLDANNDGTVSRAEFRRGLQQFGFDASPADMDAVFDEIDVNASGRLEFGELHALLRQGQSIRVPTATAHRRPASTSPVAKPLPAGVTRSQWTSADPYTRSAPDSRDRRRGHAVASHVTRLSNSRGSLSAR